MKPAQANATETSVSFVVQPHGRVLATATGQNGQLQLELSGDGPTMAIQDLARRGKYKGAWSLQANGHLKGWLVDADDRIKWFPERKKPKRKQTKKAPPVRGQAKRPSK